MFGQIGTLEIIVVLVVALLLFGRRLPEVGRSLGRGILEFKRGLKDMDNSLEEAANPPPVVPKSQESDRPAQG